MPEQGRQHVEASDWIARMDAGLTAEDELEFGIWVNHDDSNRDAFIYLSRLWDDMDSLSRLTELLPEEEQVEPGRFIKKFSIAASVMFAALAISLFIGRAAFFQTELEKTYETSIGEHSTVSLPDGSILILNTNTLATVSYKEDYRLITLERGEINIDVAHDESRPLSVKAADKVVQAFGTAFNIQLLENEKFELIVTDGRVKIGDRGQFEKILERNNADLQAGTFKNDWIQPVKLSDSALSISKGEKIILGNYSNVSSNPKKIERLEKIPEKDIAAALSWKEGNLFFNGEALEDAILEISRYTSSEFVFATEDIKKVRIAGLFKSGDVNGLLLALEDSFEIRSERVDEEKYRLYR